MCYTFITHVCEPIYLFVFLSIIYIGSVIKSPDLSSYYAMHNTSHI